MITQIARIDYDEERGAILEVHKNLPYKMEITHRKSGEVIGEKVVSEEMVASIIRQSTEMPLPPNDARTHDWDVMLIRPIKKGKKRQYYLAKKVPDAEELEFGDGSTPPAPATIDEAGVRLRDGTVSDYLREPSDEYPLYISGKGVVDKGDFVDGDADSTAG